MIARGAVFLEALGDAAERLHPAVLAQMRVQVAEGTEDVAEGVFDVAGSRWRRLAALAVPVVGRGLLTTRFARDVPFRLRTRAERSRGALTGSRPAGSGRPVLVATREFRFPGATQRVTDRLSATGRGGIVHNVLGDRGRVETLEQCTVTPDGALRMRSRAVALRVLGRRIALRGILRIDVELEDGWDEARQRRTVAMRATNPLLGTVIEYRGWYRYPDAPGAGQYR